MKYGVRTMNLNNSGYPLSFPLAPPQGLHFYWNNSGCLCQVKIPICPMLAKSVNIGWLSFYFLCICKTMLLHCCRSHVSEGPHRQCWCFSAATCSFTLLMWRMIEKFGVGNMISNVVSLLLTQPELWFNCDGTGCFPLGKSDCGDVWVYMSGLNQLCGCIKC